MSEEDSDDEYYTKMLNVKNSRQIRINSQREYNRRLDKTRRDVRDISDKDFIVAWQRSDTLDQLLKVLNVPARGAIDRSATLRKNGVALKPL